MRTTSPALTLLKGQTRAAHPGVAGITGTFLFTLEQNRVIETRFQERFSHFRIAPFQFTRFEQGAAGLEAALTGSEKRKWLQA
jgi:hypothetical protein